MIERCKNFESSNQANLVMLCCEISFFPFLFLGCGFEVNHIFLQEMTAFFFLDICSRVVWFGDELICFAHYFRLFIDYIKRNRTSSMFILTRTLENS